METAPSITCPCCGKTSYHPNDIEQGYCGFCHWWTSDPAGLLNRPDVLREALKIWPTPGPRTRRLRWRRIARLRAHLRGYFWLPCPACGQMFAGYEHGGLILDGRICCPAHEPVYPEGIRLP
jgi:hypothetical protein